MLKKILKHNKYSLVTLAAVIIFLVVWEIVARIVDKNYILPAFSAVMTEFIGLWSKKSFYTYLGTTLLRCIIGFAASFVSGFTLGIIAARFKVFHSIVRPLVALFRTTPIIAVTLLLLLWFRSAVTPVIIGFIMVFPIIYTTVHDAIASIDVKLLEMAKVYSLTAKDKLRYLYFPETAPMIFSAAITSFGLNVKAVISAEIMAYAPRSIGLGMYIAKSDFFEGTALLFAYVLIAILISALFELTLTIVKNKVLRFEKQ